MKFDQRIITLGIEIDGVMNIYSGLAISASGQKTASKLQNECTITIKNLKKSVRDYLITQTSPHLNSSKRKGIVLFVGRESIGTFKLFEGDIVDCTPSQPPDIALTIKARTGSFFMTDFTSKGYSENTPLKRVATDAANDMNLTLDFQAKDKNISNYNYSGAKLKQLDKLADIGIYNVYVDDDRLVVKDANEALNGYTSILSKNSGMIGIPEVSKEGVKVKYLLEPSSRVGGRLIIQSELNPAANGEFAIYKLSFEISNRETQFYYTAECKRIS